MSGPVADGDRTAAVKPFLEVSQIEGRGRALVASEPLDPGEIILRDSPILLYSALPLIPPPHPHLHHYCSHCFRILPPSSAAVVSCPSCSSAALFCSPNCQSVALASSHSPWVCQALARLRDLPSPPPPPLLHNECQVQARFLVAAYNLAVVSPPDFQTLLSLQGESPPRTDDSAVFLHSLISSLSPPQAQSSGGFGFSLELTSALLAKDKLNAFGIMEPFAEDRERSVRAYGIYRLASFFNHDCLPNACRFDYVDTALERNTDIVVRAMHEIDRGSEVCLSYFPVNLRYSERQQRLKEDYGFTCQCDRCKVEANWSEDEEEGDDGVEDEEEAMDEDEDGDECMGNLAGEDDGGMAGGGGGGEEEVDDFPHAYFFARYMCNRKNCRGTMAPLPRADSPLFCTVMECNVCGSLEKDEPLIDEDELSDLLR